MFNKYIVLFVDEWIIWVVLFENSINVVNKNIIYLKFVIYLWKEISKNLF